MSPLPSSPCPHLTHEPQWLPIRVAPLHEPRGRGDRCGARGGPCLEAAGALVDLLAAACRRFRGRALAFEEVPRGLVGREDEEVG